MMAAAATVNSFRLKALNHLLRVSKHTTSTSSCGTEGVQYLEEISGVLLMLNVLLNQL